jgi:hypothetical protein
MPQITGSTFLTTTTSTKKLLMTPTDVTENYRRRLSLRLPPYRFHLCPLLDTGGAKGGAQVYAKAVSGLAPDSPKLSLEDTPTEFASWISRFTSYYHASRFDVLDCKGQQGYLPYDYRQDYLQNKVTNR